VYEALIKDLPIMHSGARVELLVASLNYVYETLIKASYTRSLRPHTLVAIKDLPVISSRARVELYVASLNYVYETLMKA
jgi:glycerol-3-phosphate cytidylyltransferase-like family protein